VLDISALVAPGGKAALDAFVFPGLTYAYWVEAVFADGTASLPSPTVTVDAGNKGSISGMSGQLWAPNLTAIVAPLASTQVTNLQAGTPLSARGGSATMPGSSVTWTWNPAAMVFGYEIEWSVVDNGVTLVFGRERIDVDWSGLPSSPITVAPVTKGIPAGKTVRFCIGFFGNSPTTPLDATIGWPCVTSQTPAAPPASSIVQGGPISPARDRSPS
jgi:hypothetical protein